MAYLPAAKSASQFTQDDLKYFRIEFNDQTRDEFSDGMGGFDDPDKSPFIGFCSQQSRSTAITAGEDDNTVELLGHLESAMDDGLESSSIDHFMVTLLGYLGYNINRGAVSGQAMMPLEICGQWRSAQVDIHVRDVNRDRIKYLQVNKTGGSNVDLEPQLMAAAVAAFAVNNNDSNLELDFPCLIMCGTYPTFYRITVSRALKNAVATGEEPAQPTVVRRFNPIPLDDRMMIHLPYRREVVRCLSACKRFL